MNFAFVFLWVCLNIFHGLSIVIPLSHHLRCKFCIVRIIVANKYIIRNHDAYRNQNVAKSSMTTHNKCNIEMLHPPYILSYWMQTCSERMRKGHMYPGLLMYKGNSLQMHDSTICFIRISYSMPSLILHEKSPHE